MSADDKKHYVTSVYTGRYKSKGRIKNTKRCINRKISKKTWYNSNHNLKSFNYKPKKIIFCSVL